MDRIAYPIRAVYPVGRRNDASGCEIRPISRRQIATPTVLDFAHTYNQVELLPA
jgi:hypothetical protein